MVEKKRSFLMRVVEFPAELTALVTAGIMGVALWLEVWLAGVLGISFEGMLVPIGAGLAALFTYAVKALLEHYVPERYHLLINGVLAWLATYLGGVAVLNFVK